MEGSIQTSRPNEFVIPEDAAYAQTDIEIAEIAEYLMSKLVPVKLEDINPDDRVCGICLEESIVSEDVRVSHTLVRTVCGHIFGRNCIIRWLDPLGFWDPSADAKSHCPICRQEFFLRPVAETVEYLTVRLWFWDMAYASAGVARSEHEERTRESIGKYIQYCHSIITDEINLFTMSMSLCLKDSQETLLDFVRGLGEDILTPEQQDLRRKLERIGRKDLLKCRLENNSYVFDIESNDNEREEFKDKPLDTEMEMEEITENEAENSDLPDQMEWEADSENEEEDYDLPD